MASTIDSISGGRFGVNLVTGWRRPLPLASKSTLPRPP
ncbi:hypothetical protein [Morganella morganii]